LMKVVFATNFESAVIIKQKADGSRDEKKIDLIGDKLAKAEADAKKPDLGTEMSHAPMARSLSQPPPAAPAAQSATPAAQSAAPAAQSAAQSAVPTAQSAAQPAAPAAQSVTTGGKRPADEAAEAADAKKQKACNHQCKDKSKCGHPCCRRGVHSSHVG